jgi:hypothetical protein
MRYAFSEWTIREVAISPRSIVFFMQHPVESVEDKFILTYESALPVVVWRMRIVRF